MNPFQWAKRLPLTVRIPAMVALLMIAISAAISERVLDRLAKTQEAFLEELASSHLDAIAASILPSVLRQDSWEIFDTLERMKLDGTKIPPVETVVSTMDDIVLASNKPTLRATLSKLDSGFLQQFAESSFSLNDAAGLAFHWRNIAHQGQTVGRVFSIYDASLLLSERRQVLVTLLFTNASVTVILGFIGFISVRRMIRPMQVLETHMTEAASGKATPIDHSEFPDADREALRMYRAFNTFVRSEQDRDRLSRRLTEEEKLASLGRVASGMAHEINNPLGGLMNAVDTLRKHGNNAQIRNKSLNLIQRGLEGISDVVQAALATYRPERLARPLSPSDFQDLQLLLGPELRRKNQTIDIKLKNMDEIGPEVPAGPVRQAILNLLLNASAVSPEGADLSLTARKSGSQVHIAVQDRGPGIPDDARDILVKPGSTNTPSSSRGLGLWVIRQIADELGAALAVSDPDGCGTRIVLSIPIRVDERLNDAA